MFDIKQAIKDAMSDFERFRQEMSETANPETLSPELIKSVQMLTKQGCQALGLVNTFGVSFALPAEVKEQAYRILDFFQNDPKGVQNLATLSEIKKWDFQKHFTKLGEILRKLP